MNPVRRVIVVDRDEERGPLLARYLELRGWRAELVADARRVIRQWAHVSPTPALVVEIERNDPDAFELLGALAARAIDAPVIVCARRDLDFRALPVRRMLPERSRFALIARALDELDERVIVDAAE
jgi:DNA-binding NtrC family response regulator